MKHVLLAIAVFGALGIAAFAGQTPTRPPQQQQQQQQPPPPTADPYANNANPGATQFPLAAPAGKDSGARTTAPAGAVNQGPFNPATWKYGGAFDPPAGSKIWNPVKLKLMQGGKVTGGTLFSATDPATYCAMANAGYDFIWTEMQHNDRDWGAVARMWRTCPNAKAVPGVRVAYTDEREIQHALDAGALVEGRFRTVIADRLAEAKAAGLAAESDTSPIAGTYNVAPLLDRSDKHQAPDVVVPRGAEWQSALNTLETVRQGFLDLYLAGDGLSLGDVMHHHPRIGNLNLYQWGLWLGGHEARHTEQIREIEASLKTEV